MKRLVIDTIGIDKVVDNMLDVIVGIGVMIMSENKTITVRVLSLLLVRKSAYLKILS
jgi:hypothetical protein